MSSLNLEAGPEASRRSSVSDPPLVAQFKALFTSALLVVVLLLLASIHVTLQYLAGTTSPSVVGRELSSTPPKHERGTYNYTKYVPAPVEDYLVNHMDELGYNTNAKARETASGCRIWKEQNHTPIYGDLHTFLDELDNYMQLVKKFSGVEDIRLRLDNGEDVCKSVELHEEGLKGLFPSGQLSYSSSGYVEPLLPPMRHPHFCFNRNKHLLSLGYMVHDFGAMCRKLKRWSRIVLVDMGAALDFHGSHDSPAIYLINLFHKFGLPFDHIYAYELQGKKPADVFARVPDYLMPSYHWINVGVNATPGHHLNPFTHILNKYNEDDLIIVKLDIDTSWIEVPMAKQILENDRLAELIDQFYFEHHVLLSEVAGAWGRSMKGTVKESMELFSHLRKKGVPAHFWV